MSETLQEAMDNIEAAGFACTLYEGNSGFRIEARLSSPLYATFIPEGPFSGLLHLQFEWRTDQFMLMTSDEVIEYIIVMRERLRA